MHLPVLPYKPLAASLAPASSAGLRRRLMLQRFIDTRNHDRTEGAILYSRKHIFCFHRQIQHIDAIQPAYTGRLPRRIRHFRQLKLEQLWCTGHNGHDAAHNSLLVRDEDRPCS
jgi:predicted YcjX-like family ATPase